MNHTDQIEHGKRLYLTTKQFANLIQCHPQEVVDSRMSGYLLGRPAPDHLKVGTRKVIYNRSDVEAWIESGRVINIAGTEKEVRK